MRSSARNSVDSVSPIGSGSSIRSMAPSFFSRGDPNWRIQIALEVHGTTEVAVVTSRAAALLVGDPRWRFLRVVLASRGEPRRGASRSVRRRRSLTPCSVLWTTSPRARLRRVRLGRRRAPLPLVGPRSRRDRCLLGRALPQMGSRAVGSPGRGSRWPIHRSEPVDVRAIRAAACTRTPSCTVSYSPRASIPGAPLTRVDGALSGRPRHCACTREPVIDRPIARDPGGHIAAVMARPSLTRQSKMVPHADRRTAGLIR